MGSLWSFLETLVHIGTVGTFESKQILSSAHCYFFVKKRKKKKQFWTNYVFFCYTWLFFGITRYYSLPLQWNWICRLRKYLMPSPPLPKKTIYSKVPLQRLRDKKWGKSVCSTNEFTQAQLVQPFFPQNLACLVIE